MADLGFDGLPLLVMRGVVVPGWDAEPVAVVKVCQGYRFALDPAAAQERMFWSHAGAARFAWNWGLARCRERYEAEGRWYSGIELHRLWNAQKKADPALSWWGENSKCIYQEAFRDLDRAMREFVKSKKGQRKGARLGFPRFKKRWKCRDSFRFTTGAIGCGRATVTLPRLGTIKTHESARKLYRRIENGSARILSATVSRTAQRWFVSFNVEVERDVPERHARPGSVVGVDLGVKTLLTGVDTGGSVIRVASPRPLGAALRKLRCASRQHSRKQLGSANRRKSAARLARIHARVTAIRQDALHKATTSLAARYQTVVAEDLNVAGMTKNHALARAVCDQGFGRARRMLGYKTAWNGGTLITADRWFPSSKTCSRCGAVKAKLPLHARVYECENCGLILDRDVNAAVNLLKHGTASGAGTGRASAAKACGAEVRPGHAGHTAMKQEPGTGQRGKTGTVPRQHGTAA